MLIFSKIFDGFVRIRLKYGLEFISFCITDTVGKFILVDFKMILKLSLVVFSSGSILLQLSPKNLSGSRLWNRFEEADAAQWLLVLRKPLPHVLKNLEREFVVNLTIAHLRIAE